MRKPLVAGLALTTLITHGMVSAGMNLHSPHPARTYEGFFDRIIFGILRLWALAHGFAASTTLAELNRTGHIADFGHFVAQTVFFAGPILGFLAFQLISRQKIGTQVWKPLTILIAFTSPLQELIHRPLLQSGIGTPLAEVLRAALVLTLMVWSIHGLSPSTRPQLSAQPQPA